MEQQDNSGLTKSTMTSGAILGAALIIFTLILYMTNLTFSKGMGSISYLILIGGIVLGIKNFRDNIQGGYISYGRALGTGVLTVLFASVIVAFFTYLLYTVIDPGLLDKGLEMARNQMLEKNIPEEQMEMAMNITRKMMSPVFMGMITIVLYTFLGLLFSLIIAAIMKKEKNIFTATPTETN